MPDPEDLRLSALRRRLRRRARRFRFSRFVVGWAVSAVNDRHLTIKALEMALKRRGPDVGLVHHSDQGCTYASEDYRAILEGRGIIWRMSRRAVQS